MRLLIVSNMEHYAGADGPVSPWAAAVGEIDALASIADEVRHICALHPGSPPQGVTACQAPNLSVVPVRPTGGRGWREKLRVIAELPAYARKIDEQLRWADAVQVRAPAGIALPAILLLATRAAPARRWIKYAGEWRGRPGEPLAYRLQRAALRWNLARANVGICEPDVKGKNLTWVPNPSLTEEQLARADHCTREKQLGQPLELVFAGRLDGYKGADRAIAVLAQLRRQGVDAVLRIAGAGPRFESLRRVAVDVGVAPQVIFHGWLDREHLHEIFTRAHVILAPSQTEGWPKVLSEAMAHRVAPFAAAVGAIPATLARARSGRALPIGSAAMWAGEIAQLARSPDEWKLQADRAQVASHRFSYERYLDAAQIMFSAPGKRTDEPSIRMAARGRG